MASLREVKDHIASVRNTLKITSAMKLVSSAKLRKAQQAAEGVRPYTEALASMLEAVLRQGGNPFLRPSAGADPSQPDGWAPPVTATGGYDSEMDSTLPHSKQYTNASASGEDSPSAAKSTLPHSKQYTNAAASGEGNRRVAILAVASNSSLCGGFNVNVIHKVQDVVKEIRAGGGEVEVISVGRKMAEAMRKAGFAPEDHADLVGRNSFEKSAAFAQSLIDAFNAGRYSRILFIYNHFVSAASQKVQVEQYLPFAGGGRDSSPFFRPSGKPDPSQQSWAPPVTATGGYGSKRDSAPAASGTVVPSEAKESDYIFEPSREEILETLLPQVMRLRVHAVLLDSIAAEHAARMISMQTATDNAEDLLGELTLEYNKGRQQKITSEILDLIGGAQQ